MNLDSRGVRRGGCTVCGCHGYQGGVDRKKCMRCSHVPGKHLHLGTGDTATDVASLSGPSAGDGSILVPYPQWKTPPSEGTHQLFPRFYSYTSKILVGTQAVLIQYTCQLINP